MQFLWWSTSVLLIGLSAVIAIGQWWSIFAIPRQQNAQGQPRNYSMIPLIGGLLGTTGCLLSPATYPQRLWWLPLLVDPGCALLFGSVAVFWTIRGVQKLFGRRRA